MRPPSATVHDHDDIRVFNTRYHDLAAADYDEKWSITFDRLAERTIAVKLRKALGGVGPLVFGDALEVGAGTGYISLNLLRSGRVAAATCTDIAAGMVSQLERNAARLGLDVDAQVADAERLPFADRSFDLVVGHAVLHHIPDLGRAWREFYRVLRPGGLAVFLGEPSSRGDRLARLPKALAWRAAPLWRRLVGAQPAASGHHDGGAENHALEPLVDVHAFTPAAMAAAASAAGFIDVRVSGEELISNWLGWVNRTFEASADPASIPDWWRRYAFYSYLLFRRFDSSLLEGRLPTSVFYNLMISARKPM